MPESDVREALGALELFEGAPPAMLERLAMAANPFSLAAGEYLFREGDPGDRISLLASGTMEAIMRLPGGRELEVERLGPRRPDRRDGGCWPRVRGGSRCAPRRPAPAGASPPPTSAGSERRTSQRSCGAWGDVALERLRDHYSRLA